MRRDIMIGRLSELEAQSGAVVGLGLDKGCPRRFMTTSIGPSYSRSWGAREILTF